MQSFQDDIQHHQQKNADLVKLSEQKDSEVSDLNLEGTVYLLLYNDCIFSEKIDNLSRDLQHAKDELAEAWRSVEKEGSAVASLTAERDQLKMDLQENVEMVSLCAALLPDQS